MSSGLVDGGSHPGSDNLMAKSDILTSFGTGSPGWFTRSANQTVSSLANVPAESLAKDCSALVNPDNAEGGSLACNTYVNYTDLKDRACSSDSSLAVRVRPR